MNNESRDYENRQSKSSRIFSNIMRAWGLTIRVLGFVLGDVGL
jgi:hypothetical protein